VSEPVRSKIWDWLGALPAGLLASVYTTFVLQTLWNWFLGPALHTPEISFWMMYGLTLTIPLLTERIGVDPDFMQNFRWELAVSILEIFVTDDQLKKIERIVETKKGELWVKGWLAFAGKIASNTVILGFGWIVHGLL